MFRSPTTARTARTKIPPTTRDTDTDTISAAPDLYVTKDDGLAVVAAGNTVTYTINFGNDGSQDATGVVITETLPPGSTFNAAGSTLGWTETAPGSGIYEFNVGSLASGATSSLTFSVIVDNPLAAGIDDLVNNVSIADDGTNGPDEDPTDNSDSDTDTIAAAPDLYVTKDDGLAVVAAGNTVTYTINYGNDGSQDATGVVITETLPPGSTFNAAGSTAGWSETAPGSGIYEFNVGALASGATGSLTFSVIVDDPLAAGIDDLVNNVSIADDGANGADEDPTDNSDTDTDTIAAAPDLYITKDDGLAVVTTGNTVTYTINYGNDGSQDATGVVITETLPPGSTFNAAGSTAGWTETAPGSGIYEFNVGALAVRRGRQRHFLGDCRRSPGRRHRRPGQQRLDCGRRYQRPRRGSHRQHGQRHGYVDRGPRSVHLERRRWRSASLRRATVTYTLLYGNNGSQDATGVVITETLPANTTFDTTRQHSGLGRNSAWERHLRIHDRKPGRWR